MAAMVMVVMIWNHDGCPRASCHGASASASQLLSVHRHYYYYYY